MRRKIAIFWGTNWTDKHHGNVPLKMGAGRGQTYIVSYGRRVASPQNEDFASLFADVSIELILGQLTTKTVI